MFNCKLKRKMCRNNLIMGIRQGILKKKNILFYRLVIYEEFRICVIQSELQPRLHILSELKDYLNAAES